MRDIEGLILAAGKSTRAGKYKLGLPFGDKTVIEKSIGGMYDICDKIKVVTGYNRVRIEDLLKGYDKVDLVFNENFEEGMFSSVKTGISKINAEWFFLLPGDYPLVDEKVYRKILEANNEIVIPTYKGKKGHPVLVKSTLIEEILDEPADSTLRDYFHKKEYSTVEVDDDGILKDIDYIEDYERIKEHHE